MGNYRIITDSTADLTPELIQELDVQVIPLCYMMGGRVYHNIPGGGEMTEQAFYAKLRAGTMPTTTQVNSEEFLHVFTPLLEGGEDVLYIAFSSGLSGTCQSAVLARNELKKRFPNRRLEVFDSRCASMGEGLLVWHAAKLRQQGKSLEEVLAWLKENVLRLCHWFTVDDLNHLKRGGRVSTATALVGTMLGIKPVLHVDDEGHLIPVSKVRGRRQSLDSLVKHMQETAMDPAGQMVFISHGGRPLCGRAGAPAPGCAGGARGVYRARNRRPLRAGDSGSVLLGKREVISQKSLRRFNIPQAPFFLTNPREASKVILAVFWWKTAGAFEKRGEQGDRSSK